MKIKIEFFLILIVSISNFFDNEIYSQVSLNIENQNLEQIIDEIERQSEYHFIFNQKQIDVERKLNIHVDGELIDDILPELFKETNVNYAVLDKKILLTADPLKAEIKGKSIIEDLQQQTSISGRVSDSKGQPLPGVTVVLKGSTVGTLTDENGRYSIEGIPPNAILGFSFIGMKAIEIEVGNRTIIDIVLEEEAVGLEEVVVVGYGTQLKKTLTGAVSAVQTNDLTRTVTSTVSGALVGKVVGITSRIGDARPGAGTNLQIRNFGTPLFVIDGVPSTEADFNNIGMENVENISILKDASAAIYGLRASNGVILITTKKGRSGEANTLNVHAYYGLQSFTRFPQPADAYTYKLGLAESAQNMNQITTITQSELDLWKEGKKTSEGDYRSFDYLDFIIKRNTPSPQIYLTANATGGSNRTNYFISIGHLNQQALIESYFFKNTNIQANLETKLTDRLKLGTQISGRLEYRHQAGIPGVDDYPNIFRAILRNWPTERPYANDNPNYVNNTHTININPATYAEEVTGWTDDRNRVMRTNLYAEYDFGFGIKAKYTFSYGYTAYVWDCKEYVYDAYTYDENTDTYNVVPGGGNKNPYRQTNRRNIEDRFNQFQLNYSKDLGKHSLSAVAAFENSYNENTYLSIHSVPPNNYIPTQRFTNIDNVTDRWNEQKRASIITRMNYNYDEKYLFEFIGRYDGSYLYAENKRWGFFPGISVGWRISSESFFAPLKNIISDLKIRGSYGQTGSEIGISDFGYLGGFSWATGTTVLDGNAITTIRPRGLPVTNLSWVTNSTTNLGFDISFLNEKITGQFDIFERRRSGIPAARYDVLLPVEVGYSLPNENLNSDATRGIEGLVLFSSKAGELHYSIGVNATLSRHKSLKTYKPRFGNSYDEYRNSALNRWSNVNWGYKVIGVFQSINEIANYPVNIDGQGNRTLLPGDLKYEDINRDNIINSYDQQPIGYAVGANPYFSYGTNLTLNYKGFTFLADFAGAAMQTWRRVNELKIPFANNGASPQWMLEDRWHRANPFDPNSEWIPGANPATRKDYTSHSNFNNNNSFYNTNITYFRLKNVELSYNLPKSLINKLRISKIRVYGNVSNLLSIDNVGKKFQIDPEIFSNDALAYPQSRVITFGVNLTI